MKETLSDYVKRIMKQKDIGVRDIERNAKKRITASHVSKIINGNAVNLTADKIVGLALGLQVDPHEVFSVISGHPISDEPLSAAEFSDLMQKVAVNPVLVAILKELVKMDQERQMVVLEGVTFSNDRKGKRDKNKT